MAGDQLVGNMDTEFIINYFSENGFTVNVDFDQLGICNQLASEIFI